MDFNPHNVKYADIERRIGDLTKLENELTTELAWYTSIDLTSLQNELRDRSGYSRGLADTTASIGSELATNQSEIADTSSLICSLFNPANWFAEPQVALRRKRKTLREKKSGLEDRMSQTVKSHEAVKHKIAETSSVIERYNAFDYEKANTELLELTASLSDARNQLQIVGLRKSHVDEKLEPLLQELHKLQTQKSNAESKLREAQNLDNNLTNEDDSYERKKIHEDCERRLGTSRPRSVIREQENIISRADRDHAKAKSRVETVGKKAARVINELVVDGNNMCYEGDLFVGLSVLETVIPILAREYSIVIVFDSAIRLMLQTDDSALRERFASLVKVHVVADAEMADETILELAASSSTTYVLSNDRFADFNEKTAVNESRVIRYEIVNGKVLIHDLYLNASYS